MTNVKRTRRMSRGFSLLEMMLVVVIIGLLATVVVVNFAGQGDRARRSVTITKISQVKNALTDYYNSNGAYPAGLGVLTQGSSPFLEKIPADGWKRQLYYAMPSRTDANRPFDLISGGKDGQVGTEDDVNVWTMDDE